MHFLWNVPSSHSLAHVYQPPDRLWIETSVAQKYAEKILDECPLWTLAIVGTRAPQSRSRELIRSVLADLAVSGKGPRLVASGLAEGIDSWAHELALEFGLLTIGFVAHGLQHHYPPSTRTLRDRIVQSGGIVVSEYALDRDPRPYQFLSRNRLISGISRATWVVESSYKSGALNTARWAREQNRDCYATPAFPGDSAYAGTLNLLEKGWALPLVSTKSLENTWPELGARERRSRKNQHYLLKRTKFYSLR